MRRHAIIFHGTGADPEVVWFPWLGQRLTERGYVVERPHYPDLNVEPIATFLPKVLANHGFDEHTPQMGVARFRDTALRAFGAARPRLHIDFRRA